MNFVYLKGSCHISENKCTVEKGSDRLHVICRIVRGPSVFLLQDKPSFKHLHIKLLSTMKLFDSDLEDRFIKLWKMSFVICL